MDNQTIIPLYFKYLRLTPNESELLKSVAISIKKDSSSLSKFENGKYSSNNIILQLMKYYEINDITDDDGNSIISVVNEKLSMHCDLDNLIDIFISEKEHSMINSIYYLNDYSVDETHFDKINLFFPYQLLHHYLKIVFNSYHRNNNDKFIELENILKSTIHLFSPVCQNLFKLATSYNLRMNGKYVDAKKLINDLLCIDNLDLKIETICKYYLLIIFTIQRDYTHAFKVCNDIELLLEENPNKTRMIKFLGAHAQLYSMTNSFSNAVKTNKRALDLLDDHDDILYGIISCNIANDYSIQGKYKEAIEYFLIAMNISPDNTTCFDLAWCYFQENDSISALKYINYCQSGKILIYKEYSNLFCKWLKMMIERPYTKKCEKILLEILKKYEDSLHPQSKLFLYQQLIDYYKTRKKYELALEYALMLEKLYMLLK